jgi:16S rRNA (cytidine1402-2'-O)-methyltransferase
MSVGKLILLPNLLDDGASVERSLPVGVGDALRTLSGLICESEKAARRYLRRFLSHDAMAALPLRLLNEHTPLTELGALLAPMLSGQCWGLVTDAGLSCIADPGANLVALARKSGVVIETLPGPSSILLALQLSGFPAQAFAFHGYLPREQPDLQSKIVALEKRSREENASQLFIEAPYRSMKLLGALLEVLQPTTRLCVAASLTAPSERVASQTVAEWRKSAFALAKEPVVFVVCAAIG